MNAIKQRFKSRTYRAAFLIMLLAPVQANIEMFHDFFGKYYAFVFVGLGIVMAGLREITTKPVSEK